MEEITNDLDALKIEAATVDAANNPPAAAPGAENPEAVPAQVKDRTAEVALLLGILRPMLEIALPYIKGAPSEEWDALKQPLGDLLNHYDVDVGDWLNNPWAKLAVAAMPLAVRGFSKWQEEAAKAKEEKPAAPLDSGDMNAGRQFIASEQVEMAPRA